MIRFVKYFESSGWFVRGCSSSFGTLILKIKDPFTLNDYRPISLIECLYKIIIKALANRVKRVICSIVDDIQTGFLENWNILDGPLIVNEILSWAKKDKKKALFFKVDFDKAFDSVNWHYLDSILYQEGFGNRWRFWIRGCLASSRASILINDFPTNEFFERGPVFPFLVYFGHGGS